MDADSHPGIATDDEQFLAAFEGGKIANQDFHHRDHLRLAWIQIRRLGLEQASDTVATAIPGFDTPHGHPDAFIAPPPTLPRKRGRATDDLRSAVRSLRTFALKYPGAAEDFPWGERTIKVRGKIFAFLSEDGEKLYLTVKLPHSSDAALGLPFTSPTRYRLGRSGWVSARVPRGSAVPMDMFRDWIAESYRAVAGPHPSPPPQGGGKGSMAHGR